MLPYKYIIIIHTLPLSLGKISDKVLTTNIKKMGLLALDAMQSVVQAGEQHSTAAPKAFRARPYDQRYAL